MPEVVGGQPFKLIELSRRVLNSHLSMEQQAATFIRTESRRTMSVSKAVRWYIPFVAKNTNQLIPEGNGVYRLPSADDVDEDELATEALEEAVEEGTDDSSDLSGWLYAFTFPLIKRQSGRYPIKIGMTAVDVDRRVALQCRQSAAFEQPEILKAWSVKSMAAAEQAVHSVLKYRGCWRSSAPGTEWFDTTVCEINEIVGFLDHTD